MSSITYERMRKYENNVRGTSYKTLCSRSFIVEHKSPKDLSE
ncbi:hypothetical protein ACUXD1_002313, partial [Staphylococcus epidermidis]